MRKLVLIVMVFVIAAVIAACTPSADQAAEVPAAAEQATAVQPAATSEPQEQNTQPAPAESATAVQPAATAAPQQQSAQPASSVNVEELTNQRCSECHTMARVRNTAKTPEEWSNTVKRMQSKGMKITDEEFDLIVAFLAENYK